MCHRCKQQGHHEDNCLLHQSIAIWNKNKSHHPNLWCIFILLGTSINEIKSLCPYYMLHFRNYIFSKINGETYKSWNWILKHILTPSTHNTYNWTSYQVGVVIYITSVRQWTYMGFNSPTGRSGQVYEWVPALYAMSMLNWLRLEGCNPLECLAPVDAW